jgi:hypothetical protein
MTCYSLSCVRLLFMLRSCEGRQAHHTPCVVRRPLRLPCSCSADGFSGVRPVSASALPRAEQRVQCTALQLCALPDRLHPRRLWPQVNLIFSLPLASPILVVAAQTLVFLESASNSMTLFCFVPLFLARVAIMAIVVCCCYSWMVGFGSGSPNQVWHKLSYNTQLTYPLAGRTIYSAGESVGGVHRERCQTSECRILPQSHSCHVLQLLEIPAHLH